MIIEISDERKKCYYFLIELNFFRPVQIYYYFSTNSDIKKNENNNYVLVITEDNIKLL